MIAHFHVLASGSSGNASILDIGGFGILIDFGLSPRQLAPRMKQMRVGWEHVDAVVLTHAHTDHWQPASLSELARRRLPVYCHPDHLAEFNRESRAFAALSAAGLFRHFEPGKAFEIHEKCHCLPVPLRHDAAATCGFRFDGPSWSVGYAADLGCWHPELVDVFKDVDLLALEFNHDVQMQLQSGRSPHLIRRVLGDEGHLSNEQGANFVAEVLAVSAPGRLQHLVQLHLSQECNYAELAATAMQRVLERLNAKVNVYTTSQRRAGPRIKVGIPRMEPSPRIVQPLLPFGA